MRMGLSVRCHRKGTLRGVGRKLGEGFGDNNFLFFADYLSPFMGCLRYFSQKLFLKVRKVEETFIQKQITTCYGINLTTYLRNSS